MINNTEQSLLATKVAEIIQSAESVDGMMTMEEHDRVCEELRKIGVTVIELPDDEEPIPLKDEHGRTFFQVMIHPFIQEIADEDGEPVDGEWCNASGSPWSDEFGDELDDYPDEMFRKGWSVSSWVQDPQGGIDAVDDEEFDDYDTANARAIELADRYGVAIDHCY